MYDEGPMKDCPPDRMATAGRDNILEEQFFAEHFVDIHCHCLPGIDDGPRTMCESLAMCRVQAEEGVTTVMATPHQLGRFSGCNHADEIREKVYELNGELRRERLSLCVLPGADVRVDERICELLDEDRILTLGDGGRYILLELPHETLIDIRSLVADLASMGVGVILSHPERHGVIAMRPDILMRWLECPIHLQVTAGSLLGDFGHAVEMLAWRMLFAGWVSLIATDSHDLDGRRPCMGQAYKRIRSRLGASVAGLLCVENPQRVLRGQELAKCARLTGMSNVKTKA